MTHGDLLNEQDVPYRFWRFASKNAFSRLSLKLIPKRTARNFVDSVERRLAKTNFKHKSRLPMEQFEDYGKKRSADGFTDIVFGHFHQKVVMDVGGTRLTILPPWYETGEAMCIDPGNGEFTFVEI